ncbi:MAG: PIG-L family deacetylase [Planctomycetota bacterium]|nr:MAG: PIG-L family deacetylase [Planctomycetota bacterium]
MGVLRKKLRQRYQERFRRRARPWTDEELRASALVIAPHQDDETLGCGATIAAKRAAGARVKIVFLTDGAASHGHLMDAQRLQGLRKQEALAAAQVLGVAPENVHFFGFPDGALANHRPAAAAKLRALVEDFKPQQVFLPYHGDMTPDHVATGHIFYEAVVPLDQHFRVFEYPVWFWSRWPWAATANRGVKRVVHNSRDAAKWAWAARFQLQAFACSPEDRERKRRALAEHKTQMTRVESNPQWSVLGDVADGEFLDCFFQDYELFFPQDV